MNGRSLSILLILCTLLGEAHAQHPDVTFERIRIPGGIRENKVVKVVQDSTGFMWFGTPEGIFRYDGYSFEKYDGYKSDSLNEAEYLWDLHVDPHGVIWIAADGTGLNSLDPQTMEARRYRHRTGETGSLSSDSVLSILSGRDGTLWVGTRLGLNRLDRTDDAFVSYRHQPGDSTSLSGDEVWTLLEDKHGTLWVGASGHTPGQLDGLNRLDKESGTFKRFLPDPDDPTKLIDGRVQTLLEDKRGTLWVGTNEDGLHTLDRASEVFTRYPSDPAGFTRLSRPHLGPRRKEAGMRFMHEDRHGLLWFGAYNGGLARYDPETGDLSHYYGEFDRDGALSNNRLFSIAESHDGTIWIGSLAGEQLGLHKIRPAPFRRFAGPLDDLGQADFVWSLFESSDGSIWSGHGRIGLHRYDRRSGELIQSFDELRFGLRRPRWITAIAETSDGTMWFGAAGTGLIRLDHNTGSMTLIRHDSTDSSSLSSNRPTALLVDSSDRLWIGTRSGTVDRWDPAGNKFSRFLTETDHRLACGEITISSMHESGDGSIWVGCVDGLLRILPSGDLETFTHDPGDTSTIGIGKVTALAEGLDGSMWIGTNESGLHRLRLESGMFEHFDPSNSGLPDEKIAGVLVDDSGRVWISTQRALTRLNPATREFEIFPQGDQMGMVRFNYGAAAKGSDGMLFFGGLNGFLGFKPEEIDRNRNLIPPKIAITGFEVLADGETSFEPDVNTSPESDAGNVFLDHDQNTFRVEFVALHYRRPERNRTAHILEGFDEGWIESDGRSSVTYTAIPPGRYTFLIKAANSDGVWSQTGVSLHVVVRGPWWTSIWAYISYLIVLTTFIFGTITYRRTWKEREEARVSDMVRRRMKELAKPHEPLLRSTPIKVRSADEVFLEHVRAAIEAHIQDPHLTVERLADDVGLSVRQLRRRLRVAANLTPSSYIRTIRITRAAQILEENGGTVAEVAQMVGYNDPHYFSKVFSQVFGMPPSEYRAENRGE